MLSFAAAIVLAAIFLPLEKLAMEAQAWADSNPSSAPFLVGVVLVCGTLLLLPVSVMWMLAGLLLGLAKGFLVACLSGIVASLAAFVLGRFMARPWLERRIHRKPLFLAIDRAISRKGFLVVLLCRLVMILPYTVFNYILGLTAVGPGPYTLGTALGIAPPMMLFVYLGTTVGSIAAVMNGDISLGREQWITAAAVLAVALTLIVLLIRKAGAALQEELAEAGANRSGS
jgi:uncharacterized membrane protein YdjX (TVP38/TMEM64 family)